VDGQASVGDHFRLGTSLGELSSLLHCRLPACISLLQCVIPYMDSTGPFIVALFLNEFFAAVAYVCAEALTAEQSLGMTVAESSKLQSWVWGSTMVGVAIGGFLGGQLSGILPVTWVFFIGAMPQLLVLPLVYQPALERERDPTETHTLHDHVSNQWDVMQIPIMYRTAAYIFISYSLPNMGGINFYYYTNHLHIQKDVMAYLTLVSGVAGSIGMYIFYRYLREVPPRTLIWWGQIGLAAFNSVQLILYTRINLAIGIPDWVFIFADSAILTALSQVLMTPLFAIIAMLCPKGMEGSIFCIYTALIWFGQNFSAFFSTVVLDWYGITADNFDNITGMFLLTTTFRILPIVFVFLLPSEEVLADIRNASKGLSFATPAFSDNTEKRLIQPIKRNITVSESLASMDTVGGKSGGLRVSLSSANLEGMEKFLDKPRRLGSSQNLSHLERTVGFKGSAEDLERLASQYGWQEEYNPPSFEDLDAKTSFEGDTPFAGVARKPPKEASKAVTFKEHDDSESPEE